jgi:hypothetical protein
MLDVDCVLGLSILDEINLSGTVTSRNVRYIGSNTRRGARYIGSNTRRGAR